MSEHDGMSYDSIQGQAHGGPKVAKNGWFQSPLLVWVSEWVSSVLRPHQHSIGYTGDWYACDQKTNGELWYFTTKFLLDRILIFVLVRGQMTFKLTMFRL